MEPAMDAAERRPHRQEDAAGHPEEFEREIFARVLGSIPACLYARFPDGSFHPVHVCGLELDPRGAWTHELKTAAPWEAAPPGAITSLLALPHRAGLPAPDPALRLRPFRRDGAVAGGLLLRVEGRSVPAALGRRLDDPVNLGALAALLEWRRSGLELQGLRGFRDAVSSALPYGVLVVDRLGRVTWAGGRAAAILGVSEEEITGSDCARIFRPAGLELHPILEGLRGRFHSGEIILSRANGEEVPVSLEMAPVPARGTRGRGLAVFFQDLSEERVLEETARQRDRLAALGELSAGVAHEIRNPLTGIANCPQVLSEGMEEEDSRQRFLRIILDETARLNRIVEGLLRYARPNRPDLREVSIEELVRKVLELSRPGLEAGGIRVGCKLGGRIPRIYVDPAQVEQVLLNLLRNAEEAMPSGGEVTVAISVVRRRPHRRHGQGRRASDRRRVRAREEGPLVRFVSVRVTDTGQGIPRELLPRIFNPFYTTRSKGTGLGLSLSQSIVREHGGFLTARSVVGKGTVFHLDLPVERRQGERRKDQRSA
jgi:two-component system, NtrC family, sensor histidine kinase HydH